MKRMPSGTVGPVVHQYNSQNMHLVSGPGDEALIFHGTGSRDSERFLKQHVQRMCESRKACALKRGVYLSSRRMQDING